jgi:hypothetical protein
MSQLLCLLLLSMCSIQLAMAIQALVTADKQVEDNGQNIEQCINEITCTSACEAPEHVVSKLTGSDRLLSICIGTVWLS